MNKKNIVIIFLGDFFFDARCINMTRSLLLENYSITIICTYNKKIDYDEFADVKFYNVNLRHKGVFRYIEFHRHVLRILNNKTFDVIIAGDLYSLSSASKYKKSHIIYDCREIYTELAAHHNKPFLKNILYWYEKYFLKYVNTILTTAESDEKLLQKKYHNISHLSWKIIYNYPARQFINKSLNLKQKLNISKEYITIVYQGVIHRGRGVGQLISVTKNNQNIISIIVGDGVDKDYYVQRAKNLNIIDRVKFIDKVPYLELFNYTSICDIGWLIIKSRGISNQLALPNKLFEYTFMGLPVISSPLENMQKIIEKYNLGKIVNENSTDEQLNAIEYIQNNPKEYAHIKEKINKKFTWDVQHQKFIDLINEK